MHGQDGRLGGQQAVALIQVRKDMVLWTLQGWISIRHNVVNRQDSMEQSVAEINCFICCYPGLKFIVLYEPQEF